MNIYLALTLFSLIILIYWVISELFTMLSRFTGVPDEKARFQVISLHCGMERLLAVYQDAYTRYLGR